MKNYFTLIISVTSLILMVCNPFYANNFENQSPFLNQDPDFTPLAQVLPNVFQGTSQVSIRITVFELNGFPSNGSTITVRIPADSKYTFSPICPNIPNTNWVYLGNNGLFHSFEYTLGTFPAFGTSEFCLDGQFNPGGSGGTSSLTVTVVPFSGGEVNASNNTDAESLVFFP